MNIRTRPPGFFEATLWHLTFQDDQESLAGDLAEYYGRIAARRGRPAADMWYFCTLLKLIPSYLYFQITWGGQLVKNTIKITFRFISRNKTFSFINISGLAFGLACCLLIFLWIQIEIGYDRFHENAGQLHMVLMKRQGIDGYSPYGPGPLAAALKNSVPDIRGVARSFGSASAPVRYKDRLFSSRVMGVDPSFFNLFTFPVMQGEAVNPLPDPQSMVLTQKTALRLFGNGDPVGKTVGFEWWGRWHDFHVTAVIHDIPLNSDIQSDIFLPFEFVTLSGMDIESWEVNGYKTYVRLEEKAASAAVSAKISDLMEKYVTEKSPALSLYPLTRIHLHNPDGGGPIVYVYIFIFIGLLILGAACINFMNLSTSRAIKRAREVGLRKVVGSTRSQLIWQFLGESLIMTLLAFGSALAMAALALPYLNRLLETEMAIKVSGPQILGFLAIVLITAFFAGCYPAFFLSSFQPIRVLRGSSRMLSRGTGFRRTLMISQFVISIFLIISTLIIYRQLTFMRGRDMGINKDCVINMELRGGLRGNYSAIRNTLLEHPSILAISTTNGSFTKRFATDKADWEGKSPDLRLAMAIHAVDYDYEKIFDIQMKQGRYFARDFPSDASDGIVVNETAVRAMDFKDPLDKHVTVPLPFESLKERRIIGVVKDYHFRSLHENIEPLFLVLAPSWYTDLYIRIRPDGLPQTLGYIENTIREMAPDFPFAYSFLDVQIDRLYQVEKKVGSMVKFGMAIALFIACLGLLGLASFTAAQRTKEIGIRKVLGASTAEILLLLNRRFILWVAVANLIAWPLAYVAMKSWLQAFAYRVGMPIWLFVFAGLGALGLALLTVSTQTMRTAASDPVKSLRHE